MGKRGGRDKLSYLKKYPGHSLNNTKAEVLLIFHVIILWNVIGTRDYKFMLMKQLTKTVGFCWAHLHGNVLVPLVQSKSIEICSAF